MVPSTSDTMAKSCPVMALMRLDFPAFRRPNKAMWIRSPFGVVSSFLKKAVSCKITAFGLL